MATRIAVTVLVVALALGCASERAAQERANEQTLAGAGFRSLPIATAAQRRQAAALPAGKVSRVTPGGATPYVYADPDGCACLYAGSEEALAALLRTRARELADRDAADTSAPDPALSAREAARYEEMAREDLLAADVVPFDWSAWPGAGR